MSELDTLIVTFQTQLSDVMETVVKTAMFEVTRLVEDGFLEEVKRRNQEVESLRMQLQWVERKLRQGGQEVSDGNDGVQLSCDTPEEQMDVVNQESGMKKEANSIDRRKGSIRQEVTQAAEETRATHMIESQAIEEEALLPEMDVKEEEVNKPVCSSVDVGEWHGTIEGKSLPESNSAREPPDAQPRQTPENSGELLNDAIKHDIMQVSTGYVSPEEQKEAHMADDLSMEVNRSWAGLSVPPAEIIQNQIHAAEKDCNPAKTTGSLSEAKHELSESVTADVNALIALGGDHISTPTSPQARLLKSDVLGVTIKQEVTVGFDDCMESKSKEKTVASFSSFVKQHRLSSEALKHNPISHKAKVQELMKLHSKVGTGLRLQTAVQQLNRPMKKPHHVLSNSTTAALSVAHSQVVNFKSINRMPSTSKAAPPPPLSVQRIHLGDKQAAAHNRSVAPWVNIKTQQQSTNSHQNSALPHPDSHPVVSPRQLQRCGQCGKCFPHPSNLKAHLQTHTGERPFCCSLCGRSFTKLSNLKAHRRVHTGERPYCCLACGKRFTQKCNLKRHQRIHLDV
ncbi:gastrula zinc finger protein XlCGF48.2-like [Cheilinus undulatus]|uniref:gastrula zinc finger protein XlCGF48.2-like n=1 Tax=Cheilinus undulatus TaxID=241271 RepID=UPI001BD6CC50|nr:gastrula zinc finger protein XlCGF48.2-like [Cheilinus undulatus]